MSQESSKRETESTGCQPPEGPILCANGCGFFGSMATMNRCSKCYKDLVSKEAKATAAKVTAGKLSVSSTIESEHPAEGISDHAAIKLSRVETLTAGSSADGESSSEGPASSTESREPVQPPTNRCFSCKKRLGLTAIKCRCGNSFCSRHRYSDMHSCSYDYKTVGRDDIAQANPVVKAAKVENKI